MSEQIKPSDPASASASGSAADVECGVELILAKMRAERPTLSKYLHTRAAGEARSYELWRAEGAVEQAAFRNGMSQAYRDVERMLERDGFAPEPSEDLIQCPRSVKKVIVRLMAYCGPDASE